MFNANNTEGIRKLTNVAEFATKLHQRMYLLVMSLSVSLITATMPRK
jgi:hypothetical protein